MQFTPLQLKEKLQRALDEHNNVVDTTAVLEVISVLESYPITKEALEQTRMGKTINELRRKTNDEELAKRAKQLVRNWQKLIKTDSGTVNGERVVTPPQHPNIAALQNRGHGGSRPGSPVTQNRSNSPSLSNRSSTPDFRGKGSISPALAGKPSTPTPSSRLSPGSQRVPGLSGGRPGTPTLQSSRLSPGARVPGISGGKPGTPTLQSSRLSPGSRVPGVSSSKPGTPTLQSSHASPGLRHVQPGTPTMQSSGSKYSPRMRHSPALSGGKPSTPTLQSPRPSPDSKQVYSPVLSGGKQATPALHSSRLSPGMRSSTSASQTSVHSPGMKHVNSHQVSPHRRNDSSASFCSSKSYSPKSGRPSTPSGHRRLDSPHTNSSPALSGGNEDSNSSWPPTPRTSRSEGKNKTTGPDSRIYSEFCSQSSNFNSNSATKFSHKSNHSTELSVSKLSDKGSRKDQSDTSKTNVANRKRTRPESPSAPPVKQHKTDETSSLSKRSKKDTAVVNGAVGSSSKSRHREKSRSDGTGSNSATSIDIAKAVDFSVDSSAQADSPTAVTHQSNLNRKNTCANVKSDSAKSAKSSKVKTTAQLIAVMQQRCGNVGTAVLEEIETNQIAQEPDVPGPVLPPSVKPRRKRGSTDDSLSLLDMPSSSNLLSRTKTELVEKFLQTSVRSDDNYSPFKEDSLIQSESPMDSIHFGDYSLDASMQSLREDKGVSQREVKQENGTEVDCVPRLSVDEIYKLFPALDTDSIDWEAYEYSLPESVTVTDSVVDQLHSDHWSGVNGCFDGEKVWHDWTQTLSVTSYDDDQLHILPYVNIDD